MTILKAKTCAGLCLWLMLSGLVTAQEKGQEGINKSCQEFVSTFYVWYLPKALKNSRGPASDLVIRDRPYLLSPDLVRQLSEESEDQRKAGSDLVGLDFDPFLGGDGPAEGYVVKKVTIKDNKCWAEVYGVWDGKQYATPDVTPELMLKGGRWIFVNFYYPDMSSSRSANLLDALKAVRREFLEGSDIVKRKNP